MVVFNIGLSLALAIIIGVVFSFSDRLSYGEVTVISFVVLFCFMIFLEVLDLKEEVRKRG